MSDASAGTEREDNWFDEHRDIELLRKIPAKNFPETPSRLQVIYLHAIVESFENIQTKLKDLHSVIDKILCMTWIYDEILEVIYSGTSVSAPYKKDICNLFPGYQNALLDDFDPLEYALERLDSVHYLSKYWESVNERLSRTRASDDNDAQTCLPALEYMKKRTSNLIQISSYASIITKTN